MHLIVCPLRSEPADYLSKIRSCSSLIQALTDTSWVRNFWTWGSIRVQMKSPPIIMSPCSEEIGRNSFLLKCGSSFFGPYRWTRMKFWLSSKHCMVTNLLAGSHTVFCMWRGIYLCTSMVTPCVGGIKTTFMVFRTSLINNLRLSKSPVSVFPTESDFNCGLVPSWLGWGWNVNVMWQLFYTLQFWIFFSILLDQIARILTVKG